MLRPRIASLSRTKVETWPSATDRFLSAADSSSRSPSSTVETCESDWLKSRTVWSLSASVLTKPWSARMEPKNSSRLSLSVWLNSPKLRMVSLNCSPWPPKLSAVTSSRSESAPLRLAPLGPRATLSLSRLV